MAGLGYWKENSSISVPDWDTRIQDTSFSDFSLVRSHLLPPQSELELVQQFLNIDSWCSDSDVSSGNKYFKDTSDPSRSDIDHKLWLKELKFFSYLCEDCLYPDSDVYSGNQNLSEQISNALRIVSSSQLPRFNSFETVYTSKVPSSPLLCRKSTNKVTASNVSSRQNKVTVSNVSSRQRDSVSVMADEAKMKQQMQSTIGAPDSVRFARDCGSCALPTGILLYRHGSLNYNLTDESSDKPRPNRAPAINPLHETARTPVAHKRTDEDSEHHSNPNPCVVAERGILEKTKRSDTCWYMATGAAHHATGNRDLFTFLEVETIDHLRVHAADGTPMAVCGRGNVVTDTVLLSDVWYVPGLDMNLVSVGQLAQLDYSIGFARGSCTVSSAADAVVGRAHAREDGLYEVDFLQVPLVGIP